MGHEDSRAQEEEPSRIVIADDHPLFRSAIRQVLERQPDLKVVGEAANGREALELCRRLRPELVLMDLRMPQMDGTAATGAIRRELPDTPVLMLTAMDEAADLSDSLEAGAAGYVLKDAPPARITDAVRKVLAGEAALDEEVAMGLITSLMDGMIMEEEGGELKRGTAGTPTSDERSEEGGGSRRRADALLTPREVEVIRLVVGGRTNRQIARELSISVSTVKRHLKHVGEKLGACDRVQAAVRAIELGVLDERNGDGGAIS